MSSLQHERVTVLAMSCGWAALPDPTARSRRPRPKEHVVHRLPRRAADRRARLATWRAREMLARMAGFPALKTLDQYDFSFATGAPRKQIMELASFGFVERAENMVLLGPRGVGKTHLAIALGYCDAEGLEDSLHADCADLVMLEAAHRQGRMQVMHRAVAVPKLLIIDEIGYLPMSREQANLFFQVVARRYERGSMILTSILPSAVGIALSPATACSPPRCSIGSCITRSRSDQRRELQAQGQTQRRHHGATPQHGRR